jgi:hypothetical protein
MKRCVDYDFEKVYRESVLVGRFLEALHEAYSIPNLDWIDEMVNDLYEGNLSKSYYANKYHVFFLIANKDVDRLVYNAHYDIVEETYYIEITQHTKRLIDNYERKNDVIDAIKEALFHEDYHRQQFDKTKDGSTIRKSTKVERIERFDAIKNGEFSTQEVDAKAKEVAKELRNMGLSQRNATRKISTLDLSNLSDVAISIISTYEGTDFWKRFLMEIWRYYDERNVQDFFCEH